jgi:hypothetical protein
LNRIGSQIKGDLIEPQVDALTRALHRAIHVRAVRIAGAAVGAVTIALTAVASQPLSAAVQAVLGAGGAGLLAKEYADYENELLTLRDNPWHFAWRLRESARK